MVGALPGYAIFMLDASGQVASWNAGAQRLKGYAPEEIIGRHFSAFYGEEDRRRGHPEEVLALAAEKGSHEEEGWRYRKNGSRFWASVVIAALRDDAGHLYGFGKVTRDLTDRREAEEASRHLAEAEAASDITELLQRTTAAFASAKNSAEVAQTVLEQVLTVFSADSGSLAVRRPGTDELELRWAHGYPETVQRDYRRFSIDAPLPHSQAARERKALFFESRELINAAYPHLAPGNQLEMLASLPLLVRAECVGVLGFSFRRPRRLTDAERTLALAFADQCALALDRALLLERELEAKQRAQLLAEASKVFSSSLDAERVLTELACLAVPHLGDWCSVEVFEAGAARQVAVAHVDPEKVALAREHRRRYPPIDHPGSGLFQVLRTGRAELYAEIPDAALAAAARDDQELRIMRSLGIRSGLCAPLVAHGRTLGALSLVWAESERRYTQADLEFVCDLCARAALAVENARLYQDVRHAVKLRDDFLSIAGHEMRTPLAALLLHLQASARLARREAVGEKLRARIDKSVGNVKRLERLIDQLLDVSRISSGTLTLEPEELELSSLVEGVVKTWTEEVEHGGATIEVRTAGPLHGRWDRLRVEQAVSNLITNAMKYGRGAPIDVETGRDGELGVVQVRDRGIGIAPEDQQRIFERFERAVSDDNYGGLGLGLWIARQAIEASGGTVSVESEIGVGSVFIIRLPLR
jgi:PAS domain S-box-containing protein